MRQKLTLLTKTLLLLCALIVGSGSAWADSETLLSEDFSSITNGNNTSTSGSSSSWDGNTNFPTVSTAYQAGGTVRLGGKSSTGSITSKSLSVTAGTLTVSFDVKGWSSVEGNIKVTVGSQNQTVTYTATMSSTSFNSKSVDFTIAESGSMTVKLETTAKRAFLDNIVVTNTYTSSSSTYSVTYNGNGNDGGTVPTDANEYESGDEVTVLGAGTMTKTGYDFAYWEDGDSNPYEEGDKFNISSNTTLTAVWDAQSFNYTLTLTGEDSGALAAVEVGGTELGATDKIDFGSEVTVTVATNDGYRYGIAVKDADNNPVTVSNGKFTMPASDVTITVTTVVDPYLYVSLTEDDLVKAGASNAYGTVMTITANGYTWKTTGYRQSNNSGYIQLKSSGSPYIQLPEISGFIQTITFTVTGASESSSTGAAPTTSFEFRTTAAGSAVVSAANSGNTLTIDLSGKETKYSTGYIVSTAGARVWNITIAYTNKLTAEVQSYGWASYIPEYDVQFVSGDAYVVTAASVSAGLTMTAVTSVPAGTPVLLKGAGDKTITLLADAPSAPATNLLSVATATTPDGKFPYVLAKNGDGACFKQWTGDAATLKDRVVLYLDEAVATARSIFMLDGESTGISQIENGKLNIENSVYNLNGQRVSSPQKGLYIVNGKKVMMK